jgi:hypothetical protein
MVFSRRAFYRAASLGLILLALVLPSPATAQGKRVALVIGNAAYKETAVLTNTRNDATDIAAALRRLNFEVLDGIDLDKRAMERLIRQFDQALAGADLAVFFYAGHGIQVSGQNHLVPVDARLAAEGDLDFETLSLNLVLRRMEREAKTSLVLLDACRDNPLARNLARSMGTRNTAVGQGLAEVKTAVGTLISFSTQPGNVALDGDGRNSPYTSSLLKQIETPNKDLLTILATVRGDVVRTTGGRQVPWEHTSLLGPLVLSTSAAATPPQAAPPQTPPQTPAPERNLSGEAAISWVSVKDSTSPAVLETFIRRYGDTFHGDLAKARLAELKALPPLQAKAPAAATPDPAAGPAGGAVTQALCKDALPFLLDNGAFGSKPIKEAAYADRVAYFAYGRIERAEVLRIARDYEQKYPTRTYEIDQKTLQLRAMPDRSCIVAFEYNFTARNAQENRSGRGTSEFTLRRNGANFEVVSETGKVLTRSAR